MQIAVLNFLGAPHFERDGVDVPLVRAKGVALLLYLAVMRASQPRERVLDLLWPESLPQAARKNMSNTLWAIREALGGDLLEQAGGSLRLAPGVLVDVHQLEDGQREGDSAAALADAIAAYRGPLADGLVVHEAPDFEIWLQTERERLQGVYLHMLDRVVAHHREGGAWDQVIAHAQRALAADPLREPAHVALIEAFVRVGQRAQAAQQYAILTDSLRRELDVAPLPETSARYRSLLADAALSRLGTPSLARRTEPSLPFIGRGPELAALDEERARAAQGQARVVLLAGDLGIGKTRLWRTWADTRADGAIAVSTHALETAEPVPFGPVLTLFRQPGPAQALIRPPSPLGLIWLAELARLLPEVASHWPDLPASLALLPAEERARLLQALTEVVRLLAAPLAILIIDDLHWADHATLDWLIFLTDQLRDAPLLVIGTYRPQDARPHLQTTVASWQRQGQLRLLSLARLSDDDAGRLLTLLSAPDRSAQAADVVRQSGGNPYFLIELWRAQGAAAPDGLVTLVRARLHATVPAHMMQLLQAAAVLGDDTPVSLLQAASGRGEEDLLDALDALAAAEVLQIDGQGYRFVHPLVASIIRADLLPTRRAALHRRAAEALERAHAPYAERVAGLLTEHYAAAGDLGRAAHYAEQAAGQAMSVGAFVEATAYARRAAAWDPTARRRLLLGQALLPSRSTDEAQMQLEAALQGFTQAGDVVGSTQARIMLALMAIGTGQPEAARRWLAHLSIEQIAALAPALGAQALQLAASVERQSQAYDAAAAHLDQADQLARAHRLVALEAQIVFERGNLLASRGELQRAVAAFARALALAEAARDSVYMAMASNNLAYHTLLTGDIAEAQRYADMAVELVERHALGFVWQYVWSTAGEVALARQELDRADAAFERAFDAARLQDNHAHMANVRVNQALAARARGRLAQARELIAEAQAVFATAVDPVVRDKIARVRAELLDDPT